MSAFGGEGFDPMLTFADEGGSSWLLTNADNKCFTTITVYGDFSFFYAYTIKGLRSGEWYEWAEFSVFKTFDGRKKEKTNK